MQVEEEYNVTLEQAKQTADSLMLGGYSDWRVPTMTELLSIVDEGLKNPLFNGALGTSKSEYFWSNENRVDDSSKVWVLNAGGGVGDKKPEESQAAGGEKIYSLKCVRNSLEIPGFRYINNGDGTVTDNYTGLIWEQESSSTMTLDEATSYAEELSLGGYSDWRLPNMTELAMICDYSFSNPVVNQEYFPSITRVYTGLVQP